MGRQPFHSEEALTRWLAERAPRIGDDAALLPAIGAHAITVDSQREGVHFAPGTPAAVIARRLLAVNLSDLAAVGARPHLVLCTLAAPANFPRKAFFEALLKECDRYRVQLVGGDLSSSPTVECTLTALGLRVARGRFLSRASAEPGQSLWLAGSLGESHLGLELLRAGAEVQRSTDRLECTIPKSVPTPLHRFARRCLHQHLAPTPQLSTAHYLARRRCAIAAIDISDGLAKDLARLANASEVGLRIFLPLLRATTQETNFQALCRVLGASARSSLLTGGEDYSLAFTIPRSFTGALNALRLSPPPSSSKTGLTKIGEVTSRSGEIIIVDNAMEYNLTDYLDTQLEAAPGWDHLEQGRAFHQYAPKE